MAKLSNCWKWIENQDIKLLMNRWYYTRERWAFTEKGRAKKEKDLAEAKRKLIEAIEEHFPELQDKSYSWKLEYTRNRWFHFIREEPNGK